MKKIYQHPTLKIHRQTAAVQLLVGSPNFKFFILDSSAPLTGIDLEGKPFKEGFSNADGEVVIGSKDFDPWVSSGVWDD